MFSISSCTEDIQEMSDYNASEMKKDLIESLNKTESIVTRNDTIDDTFYSAPTLSELSIIAEALYNHGTDEGWLSDLISIYGYPDWDIAIRNDISNTEHVIIVPFIKNEEVKGIVRFYDLSGGKLLKFYGQNYITSIPERIYTTTNIGAAKSFASNYLYYEYRLWQTYNLELMNWRQTVDDNVKSEQQIVQLRNEECITYTDSWWSCAGSAENPFIDCVNYIEIITECFTVLGGSGGWDVILPDVTIDPSDSDSNPNGGNNNEDDRKDDIERERQKAREKIVDECIKEVQNAVDAAKSSLENQYGDKICIDDLSIIAIYGLIAEEIIDCENDSKIEMINKIRAELNNAAENQAAAFDQVLDDIRNSDITDPCNPGLTPDDIADNVLAGMQASGSCGIAGIQDALNNIDIIIIIDEPATYCNKSMEEHCPALKNALDLVIGDVNNPNCDILKNLSESTVNTKYIWDCENEKIRPRTSDGSIPNGQTKPIVDDIGSNVYFSKDICSLPCEEIVSIILHESLHAEIFRMGFDEVPQELKDKGISEIYFYNFLITVKSNNFDGELNQHQIMAEYYALQYAEAMWKLSGQIGNVEDYLYWAYDGLGVEAAKTAGFPYLSDAIWKLHQDNWNKIKSQQVNFNCN